MTAFFSRRLFVRSRVKVFNSMRSERTEAAKPVAGFVDRAVSGAS